ncbi:uncharacterized protein C9orf152 homolog [Pipistrellus kuhlii]|uniref:TBC1 domain-containing protein n=1 Tax=Pipistrellus kuhlii TaxID=59472 RepID=A0A7J7W2X7_PIPKU|nr:uncharacterized protein C9orf152 homolog [Pipistrellus kuhlii]KAF6331528.1 hypothetical protein mPipKuh1_001906 [Pipistrellus kuhlii]
MKGLPCPGLCPAHFWLLGSCFMAEGAGARALGQGPPLSVQLLRARYQDLRQQQRNQAYCVVLPRGGNTPAAAESMVSAVWINKERRHSLSPDQADPAAAVLLEEADAGWLQVPRSPWHTHLQMHCSVQSPHQDASQGLFPGAELRLPQDRGPGLLENRQGTPQEATTPGAAQQEHRVDDPQTQTLCSGLPNGLPGPSPTRNPQRPGKVAHYPFPQRKAPRISQAARNLGLYGPP